MSRVFHGKSAKDSLTAVKSKSCGSAASLTCTKQISQGADWSCWRCRFRAANVIKAGRDPIRSMAVKAAQVSFA